MSRQQVGEAAGYAALFVLVVVAVVSSQRYFTGFFGDWLVVGAAFIWPPCARRWLFVGGGAKQERP